MHYETKGSTYLFEKSLLGHRWLSGTHFKTKILVFPGFPKEVVNHYLPIELPKQ